MSRLCVKYIEEHAQHYYRKNGRQTSELSAIQAALRPLIRLYGNSKVTDFGPNLAAMKSLDLDNVFEPVTRGPAAKYLA